MTDRTRSLCILAALAAAMAITRINHFAPVPDASWAVFFVGGFHLRHRTAWAFPSLMLLAVTIDWLVIRGQGLDFWQHYCVSAAYWCLVPAYFAMWAGGMWLRRQGRRIGARTLPLAALALLAATALCHLIAQGSFYWISDSVSAPSWAGWAGNYADWFGPYLRSAAIYVGAAGLLQWGIERAAGTGRAPRALAP